MKTEDITPKDREEMQNIETNRRREILDKYFNRTYEPNTTPRKKLNIEDTTSFKPFKDAKEDELEKTGEIDSVGIEELKKLVAKLKELDYDNEDNEEKVSNSQNNGKVLKKVHPSYKSQIEEPPVETNDTKEIVNSFINCFVLALITATIGTGWLLYIINHI